MKKFLAVLLAALMLFSVMAVGVVAVADTTTATTAAADDSGSKSDLPSWLTELIARIKQVIAKLLLKLGIKLSWFDKIAA